MIQSVVTIGTSVFEKGEAAMVTIGGLSEKPGCHIETVRYYEKEYSASNLHNQSKGMSKVGYNPGFYVSGEQHPSWLNTPS